MNPVWLVFVILISLSTIFVFADSNDEIDMLSEKGLELYLSGDRSGAMSYFDKILEIDPNNVDALNNKGGMLLELERIEKAIPYFDKILGIDPNNPSALTNKGLAFSRLDMPEEAISYFSKAKKADPYHDFSIHQLEEMIPSLFFIADGYVEIIVYDSQDRFVTHQFAPELYVLDIKTVKDLIYEWPVTKVVNRNGQDFNVHQIFIEKINDEDQIIGKTRIPMDLTNFAPEDEEIISIIGENPIVLRHKQSQFILQEGDTLYRIYTIFRPVE